MYSLTTQGLESLLEGVVFQWKDKLKLLASKRPVRGVS